MYSDDNGDNGTDATDRRAVLAIAMETFSENRKRVELNYILRRTKKNKIFFMFTIILWNGLLDADLLKTHNE